MLNRPSFIKLVLYAGLASTLFGCGVSEQEIQEMRAYAASIEIPDIPQDLETVTWEKSPNSFGLVFLQGKTVYERRRYSTVYFIDPTTRHYLHLVYGCGARGFKLEWEEPTDSKVIAFRAKARRGKPVLYLLRIENLQTGQVISHNYEKCLGPIAQKNKQGVFSELKPR